MQHFQNQMINFQNVIDHILFPQVRDAESLFNFYRREGHQFDVEVYNRMLFGWAEKVGVLLVHSTDIQPTALGTMSCNPLQ